ncbi:MAG: hypothetical protein V1820_02420 [archaeon]
MTLKEFKEYLKTGVVKKQAANKNRAASLVNEAEEKKEFLKVALKSIPTDRMNPNFVVESCYDIVMELVRAKMFLSGLNASSHEAEVSYMSELGFSEADVRFADDLRYGRNGIKYYGTTHTKEFAEKTLEFMKKVYPKLKELLR